jgi:isoquinoline 1-oxidoreductase beta subunit
MKPSPNLDRRDFLQTSAGAAAGLVIGFHLFRGVRAADGETGAAFAPNAFLRIAPDETVTVIVNKSEMGQGVYTALPMIVAEELDADWSRIRVTAAPVAPEYYHVFFGIQMTGASTSVISSWDQLRKAGATARAMLVATAAAEWGVDAGSCRTESGFVVHPASNRRLSYGSLAIRASSAVAPAQVPLKNPKEFQIIGKPLHRLDTPDKVTGKAQFGMDISVPGMLIALVARPPVFGGKASKWDAQKAKAIPGVRHVVEVSSGIAVVAEGFWAAKKGREALAVTWDAGPMGSFASAEQRERYARLAAQPGMSARRNGDAAAAINSSPTKLESVYEVPYLAHATMEPLNCVADVRSDRCEVWTGTQMQSVDRDAAAQVAGLKPEQVQVHTAYLGGGFGRKAVPSSHFVREAVEISKKIQTPVKVIWTREDDMKGGYYRPAYCHRMSGGLGPDKKPTGWLHRIVGQSILAGTLFEAHIKDGIDETSVQGAAEMPYGIPAVSVELQSPPEGVPVLWWRSVGHSHTAFAVESFIDEMAHAAGADPVEYRLSLLEKGDRGAAVLQAAAKAAGWGSPMGKHSGRGVALHHSFSSCVAHVFEVTQEPGGPLRMNRIVSAVDCGQVVNPEIIRAQIEGAVVFGLSAALHGEITLEKGRVQQSNFHNYKVLRSNEVPPIEVHIVRGDGAQGGIGEPGVPPVAPALCNAIFAATGKRLRRLPVLAYGAGG